MKVRELISLLRTLNPDASIFMNVGHCGSALRPEHIVKAVDLGDDPRAADIDDGRFVYIVFPEHVLQLQAQIEQLYDGPDHDEDNE